MPDFLTALKAELAKPAYAGKTDAEAAAILAGPGAPLVETRTVVPANEVFEAIVPGEWASLTAQEKQRVQTILGMGQVDLSGVNTRANLAAAFGPSTTTRANFTALQTKTTPRRLDEELFGFRVGVADVATARTA